MLISGIIVGFVAGITIGSLFPQKVLDLFKKAISWVKDKISKK